MIINVLPQTRGRIRSDELMPEDLEEAGTHLARWQLGAMFDLEQDRDEAEDYDDDPEPDDDEEVDEDIEEGDDMIPFAGGSARCREL
jgi:hypothetical protein